MEITANREIRTIKVVKAPLELVWKVWTKPEHITNWWGPDGFTSTILKMDVREEGEWKLTLHGPDGTNYPNKSIFEEIIPRKKIAFEHFYPRFFTTVLFEPVEEETKIDWTMQFESPELRETIVRGIRLTRGKNKM
jgi:uncharacterized protein YndB with AHSA1/START domain